MATCRSCGARITWLVTPTGKPMPVNEGPDPKGNVVVTEGDKCRVVGAGAAVDGPRYMPHWATCPQAKDWKAKSRD